MFCLSMEPNHLKIIKEFDYLPVGLGKKDFSVDWFLDNKGDNISQKKMTFYYSEKDKPHYQVFSNSKSFVKKHFPQGKIKKKLLIV